MAFMTVSRLCTRRLLGPQTVCLKAYQAPSASTVAEIKDSDDHDARNTKLNRPMSPHLTIYKFQMSSVLSITHRITGLALSGYAMGLSAAALTMPDFNTCLSAVEAMELSTPTIMVAKFMLAFPLMYHTCNGVRHLMWDTGILLNKESVVTTGSAMLVATALTTGLVMFL